MNFTTTKKKLVADEPFPATAVLTQNGTTFTLNKFAMNTFGFPLNKANASKIANGFDDDNKLVLASLDTEDAYTNNITAKNTFSSSKFAERLASQFSVAELPMEDRLWVLDFPIDLETEVTYAYVNQFEESERGVKIIECESVQNNDEANIPVDDIIVTVDKLPELPEEVFVNMEKAFYDSKLVSVTEEQHELLNEALEAKVPADKLW